MKTLFWLVVNTLQAMFLLGWSALWISAALVVLVVTRNPDAPLWMARHIWGPGLAVGAGIRMQREPLPGFDLNQPHIYVMNHQSMFDIVVAFTQIPVNIRFIAKEILKYVPFLGWYMWATGMVFVDRSNRKRAVKSLALAGERIRGGANILVYPEGTRTSDGRVLPFKKGPFVVALESRVPIVPVAIHDTGKLLPKGGFRLRPGVVRVKFGTPIPTDGLGPADRNALMIRVREALIDLHRDIGGPESDREHAIAAAGREGADSAE